MQNLRENLILTDVDGCLIYWEKAFHLFMIDNNIKRISEDTYDLHTKYEMSEDHVKIYSKLFNESAALYKIPPFKDAIKYVKKLHEEFGFTFHCISAVPDMFDVYSARKQNLEELFGKTAVERIYLSGSSEHKRIYLEKYRDTGCYWVEDVTKNAIMGLEYGLNPILINQPYNINDEIPDGIIRVNNWKEIYEIVSPNL